MDILMWQWKRRKFLAGGGPSPWGNSAMRQSFHHPALTTCGAPLPAGKKYVAIRYLTADIIFFVVDVKGKGQEIFEDACKYLGLQDTELFGLALIQDDGYIFIDPSLKISKYAVKSWKTTDFGIGGDGQPLLMLYLRVKHYVDCHLLISEKIARHHYYLQLRNNVKNYLQPVGEEKSFVLAALALQADLGNYSAPRHTGRYFDINNYFPSWIVLKIGEDYITRNIPALHKDNAGLSRGEAQVAYIKEASDKTAPHNLHIYKMQRRKGKSWNTVWLGISDNGLHIYEQQELEKTKSLLSTFLWCDIAKLHFEKKKFEIVSEGSPEYRKFTYYVSGEELAKHLLGLCQSTHHFHMNNEMRVQELKKLELDGGKYYRESYIYTDQLDMARHAKQSQISGKAVCCQSVDVNGERINGLHESSSFVPDENANGEKSSCSISALKNRSMETLPLSNGYILSPDVKYKSQSIACFSDRFLTPCSNFMQGNSHLWNPSSNTCLAGTPTSTLLSQRSCASCTDSACSSLSLASGSTVKASTLNINSRKAFDDSNQWVKCDSFEELTLNSAANASKSLPHKVCISTFRDSHVRTASLYNAAGMNLKDDSVSHFRKMTSCALSPPSRLSSSKGFSPSQVSRHPNVPASQTVAERSDCGPHFRPRHATRPSEVSTCRTATRIGVSSLSRDQRLPLSLFNGKGKIVACGSEPNLYNAPFDCDGGKLTDFSMLRDTVQNRVLAMRKPNSRSEICLIGIGEGALEHSRQPDTDELLTDKSADHTDFPFIPPPPAYRNLSHQESVMQCTQETNRPSDTSAPPHRELHCSASSPPDVLDIQQLRQKSQDMDLPLISALCNDRSLLMLPKTVPTCSRQRHLGNKDPLRFARGYSTTPSGGHVADFMGPMGRPATWHVESSSATSPWFGSTPAHSMWYAAGQTSTDAREGGAAAAKKPNLPPTILTSFGKTPDKCNASSDSSSYQSSDYRLDKLQMIPTKLLSGIVSNGKIHLKGSSS